MKTVLFSFASDKERDHFLEMLKDISDTMVSPESTARDGGEVRAADAALIQRTLDNIRLDPPVRSAEERQGALYVAGQKLVEGSIADMNKRFEQEIASHGGTVEIRELRGGQWVSVRTRRAHN